MSLHRPARVIGLISDTHGLVRSGVHAALSGVEAILHAGDVGGPDVLDELGVIAPVVAVFGNTDPPGVPGLEQEVVVSLDGVSLHVSHGHELGSPHPEALLALYPQDVIVYGHTHRQLVFRRGDRIVVNPGAAGPRRFNLRPSVARLAIEGGSVSVEIIELEDDWARIQMKLRPSSTRGAAIPSAANALGKTSTVRRGGVRGGRLRMSGTSM